MKTIRRFSIATLVIAVILSLNGCAGMSARDRNTAIGAGVGAVGGVLPLPVEALSERLVAQRLVALSVTRSEKVKNSPNGYTNLRPSNNFYYLNVLQLQCKRLGGGDLA